MAGTSFCTECGARLSPGEIFCTECGKKVDAGPSEVPKDAPGSTPKARPTRAPSPEPAPASTVAAPAKKPAAPAQLIPEHAAKPDTAQTSQAPPKPQPVPEPVRKSSGEAPRPVASPASAAPTSSKPGAIVVGVIVIAALAAGGWYFTRSSSESPSTAAPKAAAAKPAEVPAAQAIEPAKPAPATAEAPSVGSVEKVFADADLQQMLAGAVLSKDDVAGGAMLRIKSREKPARGDRAAARKINDQGLAQIKAKDFPGAIKSFTEAMQVDPLDPEFSNNLGFAYLMAGLPKDALGALEQTLLIAPDRVVAWSNVTEVLAASKASVPLVTGALATALRLASDKDRVSSYFEKKIDQASDPEVKERFSKALGAAKAK